MNRCAYRSNRKMWSGERYPFSTDDGLKDAESVLLKMIKDGTDEVAVVNQMQLCFRIFGRLMSEKRLPFNYVQRFGIGGELYYDYLPNVVLVEQQRFREKHAKHYRESCVIPRRVREAHA